MKILNKITNGILLIVIGILHSQLAFSPDGFGNQFLKFSKSYFFKISTGLDELPAEVGKTNFETFAAFWFFYFGIFLIPLGLLVHSIEKDKRLLPNYFTVSYLIFVLIGCYMVPNSGLTIIMLPHGIYMLVLNYLKAKKVNNLSV
jgi:hypothetical protein